ncbi:MAG: family 20 glycosylhydrolase [FCB group bacterium]|nr:family 20 glycosylhydrolase [FCB group bacterium]
MRIIACNLIRATRLQAAHAMQREPDRIDGIAVDCIGGRGYILRQGFLFMTGRRKDTETMRFAWIVSLGLLLGVFAEAAEAGIIPLPAQMESAPKESTLTPPVSIVCEVPEFRRAAELLAASFEAAYGEKVSIATKPEAWEGSIITIGAAADPAPGDEGYALNVTPQRVSIRAAKPAGAFYGTQTLLQLLPVPRNGATLTLPCISIADQPRFGWRGLMLDCSRTFLSLDYLRRYIDRMAFYKLNVLHLHLTDDQGWRVEIKKHPKLTEAGAQFDPRLKGEISGYYTQDELRALVRYAADRNVTLVPEIEMPSHALGALTAYPDLSCRGDAYNVVPFVHTATAEVPAPPYGVFCAGNERTFEVLEDVLAEVIDIFPSKYIHIGGDECPKEFWKSCPKCQARMKAENLANEDELQSYFVKRIEKFINAKGRVLLGWDEILEGGLAPNATVMAWRGVKGGIAAAQDKHDVAMAPTTHCYFDYDYITTPLKKTYSFEPIPEELTPEEGQRVLGAQGCMWTHIARTERDIDAQIFPRVIALAEVTWSPKDKRNWPGFEARMNEHYARLDALSVAYHVERPVPAFAVAPDGTPWAVVKGRPYAFVSGDWKVQPGEVIQVAFAPDGKRYALDTKAVAGGNAVLEWNGDAWAPLQGAPGGVFLAAGPNDTLWVISDNNILRKREGGAWSELPGRMVRVAVGANGHCYALSTDTLGGGYGIREWKGTDWALCGPDAAAVEIAAGPDGTLWAVNSLGVTWRRTGAAWSSLGGLVNTAGAAPDGTLLGLGMDPATQQWVLKKAANQPAAEWHAVEGGALP